MLQFPFSDARHTISEFLLASSMGIKERVVNEPQPKLYILNKNQLKMSHGDFDIKSKTIQLSGEKKEENLWDLGLGEEFLG